MSRLNLDKETPIMMRSGGQQHFKIPRIKKARDKSL
jgi:hypothetical protein